MSRLYFDGCDTVALAEKYGTPLYVVSENEIVARCREIKEKFLMRFPNTKAVYASKAFLTLEMCRVLAKEGIGLDVVSGGELFTAIRAGVPTENIYFHGNNKTKDEMKMAVDAKAGRVVVDNEYELDFINEYAKTKNETIQILFRITPGVDSHTHKFISTGQLDSKFGISLEEPIINGHIKKAMQLSNVKLLGFHFHVGSQLLVNDSHLAAADIAMKLIKNAKEKLGFITTELNIGGGLGIHYCEDEKRAAIESFLHPVMKQIYGQCEAYGLPVPTIVIEPGRWIVGEAGITLYTVGSMKEVPGIRTYAAVDGGMPDNPRPALYDAKYEAIVANKADQEKNQTVTIAGKCCESGDVLIWDLAVPKLDSGDILAVLSTGAYNYSMASNYNRLPRPAVVMVKDGEDRLIVKRETYEDLISREI